MGQPLWMLGFGADQLRTDLYHLLVSLFKEGVLDDQFLELRKLDDERSPNFVAEVINLYFRQSDKLLQDLRSLLMERDISDYKEMGIHLYKFIGSSSTIGAKRVTNVCLAFRAASEQKNRAGCLKALELLEHEYCTLNNNLHEYLEINQQRRLAATVRYPVQNL